MCLLDVPEVLNVSVDDDVNEGLEEVEQEPDVDHLDVGGGGQPGAGIVRGSPNWRFYSSFYKVKLWVVQISPYNPWPGADAEEHRGEDQGHRHIQSHQTNKIAFLNGAVLQIQNMCFVKYKQYKHWLCGSLPHNYT